MALFDKLKFWKKEEEAEYPRQEFTPSEPSPLSAEQMGMPRQIPGINEPPSEPQTSSPFAVPQAFQQQQQFTATSTDQQLQLISSKLDTIKAQLETVLQRLERLEKKDELSPYQQRWRAST